MGEYIERAVHHMIDAFLMQSSGTFFIVYSVVRNFRTTASDGENYHVRGSNIGANFSKLATSALKENAAKWFALNDDLLDNM